MHVNFYNKMEFSFCGHSTIVTPKKMSNLSPELTQIVSPPDVRVLGEVMLRTPES